MISPPTASLAALKAILTASSILKKVIVEHYGNEQTKIINIGVRPGEKIHEVLVNRHEFNRVIKDGEWLVILPMVSVDKITSHYANYAQPSAIIDEYSSASAQQLTVIGIKKMLELGGFMTGDFRSELSELGPDDLLNYFKRERWIR